jgi:hypothetical protein
MSNEKTILNVKFLPWYRKAQWPKDKRTKGQTMMEKHCIDIRNTLNTGSKSGAAAKYI